MAPLSLGIEDERLGGIYQRGKKAENSRNAEAEKKRRRSLVLTLLWRDTVVHGEAQCFCTECETL